MKETTHDIAVTGDYAVARTARFPGIFHVTQTYPQCLRRGAFAHRFLQIQRRNPQQRRAVRERESGIVIHEFCCLRFFVNPLSPAGLPLPEALGLWNGGLCTSYPLTLGMLDPAFSLPAAAWAVQGLLLAAGVLLLLVAGKGKKVYNQ